MRTGEAYLKVMNRPVVGNTVNVGMAYGLRPLEMFLQWKSC